MLAGASSLGFAVFLRFARPSASFPGATRSGEPTARRRGLSVLDDFARSLEVVARTL